MLCLVGWVARLGFLADLLSRPVLIGYLAGVAVIMIVSQLERVTGVPVEGDSFVSEIVSFGSQLDQVHPPTAMLAATVLVFLLVAGKLFPRLPIPLLGVLLAAGLTAASPWRTMGSRSSGRYRPGCRHRAYRPSRLPT